MHATGSDFAGSHSVAFIPHTFAQLVASWSPCNFSARQTKLPTSTTTHLTTHRREGTLSATSVHLACPHFSFSMNSLSLNTLSQSCLLVLLPACAAARCSTTPRPLSTHTLSLSTLDTLSLSLLSLSPTRRPLLSPTLHHEELRTTLTLG